VVIARKLKEPQAWQDAKAQGLTRHMGSYGDLFGDPRWRKNAIIGLLLASSGVIGLWAIGFFSADLNRLVFVKHFEQEARDQKPNNHAVQDHDFILRLLQSPEKLKELQKDDTTKLAKDDLLDLTVDSKNARPVFDAMLQLQNSDKPITRDAVL